MPLQVALHANRAQCFLGLQRLEDAAKAAEEALALAPDHAKALSAAGFPAKRGRRCQSRTL